MAAPPASRLPGCLFLGCIKLLLQGQAHAVFALFVMWQGYLCPSEALQIPTDALVPNVVINMHAEETGTQSKAGVGAGGPETSQGTAFSR